MHTVTVELRLTDLLRAQLQLLSRMRVFKMLFVGVLFFSGCTVFTSHPRMIGTTAIAVGLFVSCLLTVMAVVVVYVVVAVILLARLRRRRRALQRHEFVLAGDGLRVRAEAHEDLVPWGRAKKVFKTASFFFIGLNPVGFYVIPRCAFADRSADEQFWNAVQPLVAKTES